MTTRSDFDLADKLAEGFRFVKAGPEWTVTTPTGETGHGESPEIACLNVGAQIVPQPDGRRVLIRRDGTEILLDVAEAE